MSKHRIMLHTYIIPIATKEFSTRQWRLLPIMQSSVWSTSMRYEEGCYGLYRASSSHIHYGLKLRKASVSYSGFDRKGKFFLGDRTSYWLMLVNINTLTVIVYQLTLVRLWTKSACHRPSPCKHCPRLITSPWSHSSHSSVYLCLRFPCYKLLFAHQKSGEIFWQWCLQRIYVGSPFG